MSSLDLVHRYMDAWNRRNADAILATLGASGTYEDPSTQGPISGEALRAYVTGLWTAFPDLAFDKLSVGETGPDSVAAQWIMRGTNTGSMMGLPPTGKKVELRGADFFVIAGGSIASVTGHFDTAAVPRQLGLNVIVQPFAIGPFKFGTSTSVQTGRTQEPGAFSITQLEALDDEAGKIITKAGRDTMIDMLKMDGFIGSVTANFGSRRVTISAWASPEDSRQVMKGGAHADAMRGMYDGSLAKQGFTSVWTKHRVNPYMLRCDSCGKMTRGPNESLTCSCGTRLPDPAPYW
ncbi:MAG: ester cyclase [Rhizobiales bacterium]|nr:ester cyclase [Hyphomicrobiales bacterium]MBI3672406.1 ester cyclase [Hyphomicrobiales bacterium]